MWVCPDRAATSLCAHLKRHFLDSLSPESSLKGQTEQIFLHMLKLLLSVQSVWFLKFDDSALAAWRDTTSQLSAFLCHHLTCFEACGCEVFTQRIVNQTWIQSGFCLDLNEVESCRGGGSWGSTESWSLMGGYCGPLQNDLRVWKVKASVSDLPAAFAHIPLLSPQ